MKYHKLTKQLRSSDTKVFDSAFDELRQSIDSSIGTVYRVVQLEQNPRVKGALIELLGESKDPRYVPYLAKQLESDHPEVKFWALVALQTIGTLDTLRLLEKQIEKRFSGKFPVNY